MGGYSGIPGVGGTSVDPGNQSAQILQKIMEMYKAAQGASQGPNAPRPGVTLPGMPGGAPPSMTPGAPPSVPGASPLPQTAAGPGYPMPSGGPPQRQPAAGLTQTPYEFGTKGGRNAAIADRLIGNVVGVVDRVKQQKSERERYGSMMDFMTLSNAMANGDQKMIDFYQNTPEGQKRLKRLEKAFSWSPPGVEAPPPEVSGVQDALKRLGGGGQQGQQPQGGAPPQAQSGGGQQLIRPQGPPQPLSQDEMHQAARVKEGLDPSADVKVQQQMANERKAEEIEYRRESLAQQKELTLQRLEDARTTAQERAQLSRELAQMHHADTMMRLGLMNQAKLEKSHIPPTLVTRVSQAQIIKEQTADLRKMLEDPEVTKYIGPVAGVGGFITRRVNGKVQEFAASQETLDALLPILHAYRGGAQTHEVFKKSMGTLTFDPKALRGTLKALDKLADNVTNEVKTMYPNDPIWQAGAVRDVPAKAESSGPKVTIDKDGSITIK